MPELIRKDGKELVRHGTADFPCSVCGSSGGGFPWHWHEELEMLYVLRGTLVFAAANQRHVLTAGDGMVVNANVPHAVFVHGNAQYEECDIEFLPSLIYGSEESAFFDKYFRLFLQSAAWEGAPLYQTVPWQNEAAKDILRACTLFTDKPALYEFRVREALTQVFLALWENTEGSFATLNRLSKRRSEQAKDMMQYLQDNLEEKITLRQLGEHMHLSIRECQRVFESSIGMTPLQYLSQIRLKKAADLIKNTEKSMTEICFACGIADASYFAKQFRQRYGMTPRQYRASHE